MSGRATLDVAIVGGGPGGLSAAAAILRTRPELKVGVFERESKLRRVGNFLMLHKNGQSALQALQPKVWERVEKDLIILKESVRKTPTSETTVSPYTSSVKTVAWYNLRQGLSEILPKGCLKLGYKLQGLVQEDHGVVLNFSSPAESYHAKVVVGCDGYRSQVREIFLRDGPPTFKNKICWRGVIEWPKYWSYNKSQVHGYVINHGFFIMGGALDDQYLGWQAVCPYENQNEDYLPYSRSGQLAASSIEYKKRCLDAFEEVLPEYLVKAIKDTPADSVTEHGFFARHPDSCDVWGKGCITLLGDAAHGTTPALGQGVSQALIDAVELGRAIGELGPCSKALRHYEDVRIEPVQLVQKGSWDVTDGSIREKEWLDQNPWCISHVVQPL